MTAMSSEMRSSVAALSTNLAERNRTPWAVIIGFCSVSITILGGLGFLALQSIKDSLSAIVDRMVTRQELEYRTARGMAIAALSAKLVNSFGLARAAFLSSSR